MKKVLWVKFGWSEFYRGGPVDGNFAWLNEAKGTKRAGKGHEAYNFLPATDGSYYAYVPPQSGTSAPSNPDPDGWTVICLAKNPDHPGVHVIGWFENATLVGEFLEPPEDRDTKASGDTRPGYDWSYCIKSDTAFFVPPEYRNLPFSDPSVRQGKYSFLSGPNVKRRDDKAEARKAHVLTILEDRTKRLRPIAVRNPDADNPPDPEVDETDPLGGFGGSPEQRRTVEKAAEKAVIAHYKKLGYTPEDRTKTVCGYDFCFTKGAEELHVEVKGTSGGVQHFYLTRNEYNVGLMANDRWRLAIVTNALTRNPSITIYTPKKLNEAFGFEPICYEAKLIPKVST